MACNPPHHFPHMPRQQPGHLFILRVKIIQAAHLFGLRRDRLVWSSPPLLDWNLPPPLAVIVPLVVPGLRFAPLPGGVMLTAAAIPLAPLMLPAATKRTPQIPATTVA